MYNLILLDADGTLFDYDKAEKFALKRTLNHIDMEGDLQSIHKSYRAINHTMWQELELGKITKEELRLGRFKRLFKEFGIKYSTEEFSSYYLKRLGEGSYLIEGAEALCRDLSKTHRLVILTNGMKETQISRLNGSSIKHYVDDMIISEEVGVNKPDPYIFEYTLKKLGHMKKTDVLMVGDSLSSDIKGGVNFGIDTCWYNPKKKNNCSGINPKYEISTLEEIVEILD